MAGLQVNVAVAAEFGLVGRHDADIFARGGKNAVAVIGVDGREVEHEHEVAAHECQHLVGVFFPKFHNRSLLEVFDAADGADHCVVEVVEHEVFQIVGIDQIGALDYQRANVPASIAPRRAKNRFVTDQQMLHLDLLFAEKFFKSGVWGNEFEGVTSGTTLSGSQFIKFSDANSDPVKFFDARTREIHLGGRRKPNKLTLGYDTFNALKEHPDLLERVKYTGSTANPAKVNEHVLAELFGFEQVKVLDATYNKASKGQEDDMDFVCEPDGALLTYTTSSPALDEPSAGYIFTWDMLGNGNYIAIDTFEGEGGTHSEFMEGLLCADMEKTCDDLACYMKECV